MRVKTLLPPNATAAERALEQVMAHVGDLPLDIRTVKNPDTCPAVLLPWLAWEYAITWWDESWTEAQKRSVIKSAAGVNKRRGTGGAVRRALAALDYPCEVIEWFRDTPKAAPYTFRVKIHGNNIPEETLARLAFRVNDAKNARSLLSGITVASQVVNGTVWTGGAFFIRQSVTIKAKRRE
ncbi:phage tail protein I [Pantoea agglomerans]|uniref:phage tail protein I n=1 Tax=Enterobacter agglomerans TaxID=549 RepID=UPI0013B933B3|nr:phage tail protein I [Pantoea agglomerans]NEG58183.1 phage tail protein I [Pantoea agglomerans]NEG99896.1 phage tail protein I [Pantoea agglomerans]NEH04141.1 phage tail protein I [Pantoea agglomerans]NEH14456.1 phage tail protein I [Pantoea agglomerans]